MCGPGLLTVAVFHRTRPLKSSQRKAGVSQGLRGPQLSEFSISGGWFVQQHRELELLASFRERFGCDWLQYRSHLESMGSPPDTTTKTPALSSPPLDAQSLEAACSPPAVGEEDTKESPEKVSEEGREEPEPHEGEKEEQDEEEGLREDLEEDEEPEQKGVEGERPVTTGALGTHGVGMLEGLWRGQAG